MYIVEKQDAFISCTNVDSPREGMQMLNAGMHRTQPGHTFGPAVREYFLIHFVVRGHGTFFAEGQTYELSAGQCFLIRPMQVTTYRASRTDPWVYYWLAFAGGEAESLVCAVFPRMPVASFDAFELTDMQRAMDVEVRDHTLFDLKLRRALHGLLFSAYRTDEAAPATDVVLSARRYIAANYDRNFDIAHLARELGYTRTHFSTLFARAVGMPPHAYLVQYRLMRARTLLCENPRLTVTEIAFSVGFNSIERFSAAFKHKFGMSPRAAKQQAQANILYE